MRLSGPPAIAFALILATSAFRTATCQNSQTAQPSTPSQSLATLTPEEKQQFDLANKDSAAEKFADALVIHKSILAAHPGDPLFSKYASETAINTGDTAFAIKTLVPVESANTDDWQTASLLARAYAESGDKSHRDAEILHMADLQARGITPPRLQQYILEKVHTGDRTILIWNSVVPWGNYKIQNFARVTDNEGHLLLLISLENSDFDQPQFAKEHPKEAAAGARRYSLDGYKDTGTTSTGLKTQLHMTFKFFDGRPSYDVVRQEIIAAAIGKSSPMSSRSNLPVPQ